jgi:hypothetical protein
MAHSLCTVLVGCAGRVGPGTDDEASKGSLISVLRAFRLVRLFKLAQYPFGTHPVDAQGRMLRAHGAAGLQIVGVAADHPARVD